MAVQDVYEAARDIPVLDEADVLVVGGGVAGCAAAYAAAKAGSKAVLLERNGCLGGVATATLMANIGNVYVTGTHEQVVRGFAGEVADRMVAIGAASPKWASREVPGCVIDSERFKVVLIEMLEEAGVTILTPALGARPVMEDTCVQGAFVESKSGRQAVLAKATVDCTGEGDMAWQAGAEVGMEGGTASTLFKLANVDLEAFVGFLDKDPDGFPDRQDMTKDLETFDRNWRERGILFFPHGGGAKWRFMQDVLAAGQFEKTIGPANHLHALGMYALKGTGFVVINSNFYRIENLDVRNLSAFELHAQKMCYYVADFMKNKIPGFENACVAHVGVDLGIRTSRIVHSRTPFHTSPMGDAEEDTFFDDAIGTVPVWDREWRSGLCCKAYTCDVPFGVTVPVGCQNLLNGSGKSVHTRPKGTLRSMVGCMICGQATGAASALAAQRGIASADVPIRDLQRELIRQGARLGKPERIKALGLA